MADANDTGIKKLLKAAYRASPKGKATVAAYNKHYAQEHRDELREKRIALYLATKDQKRESKALKNKEWRDRNKEAINARRRDRIRADEGGLRARAIERSQRWYEANKERVAEASKAYYTQHREKVKQRVREYQQANPDETRLLYRIKAHRRRERLREAGGNFTRKDVENLLLLQRCQCANCRKSLKSGFHIDHKQPVALGGDNGPLNIELLCPKCNMAKSDKHPHVFAQEQGRLI